MESNALAKVTEPAAGSVGDSPIDLPVIGTFEDSLQAVAAACKERGGGAVIVMSVPTAKRIAVKQIVEVSPVSLPPMIAAVEELLQRLKDLA